MEQMRRRVLIVEGNTREVSGKIAAVGGTPYGEWYAALVDEIAPGTACTIVRPADEGADCLPDGLALTDFDGAIWTGSALNVYDAHGAVTEQLRLAERVMQAGVPAFGSCWALQVFATILGGKVRANPKGREIGIATGITLTDAGHAHPMYAGKPRKFSAFAVHVDEVAELPRGAVVLSCNDMCAVQSFAYDDGDASLWAVQYHPEFDHATMARVLDRLTNALLAEGLFRDVDEVHAEMERYSSFDARRAAGRVTANDPLNDAGLANPDVRRAELSNWLLGKVGAW
ncbi:MAG: type 1 glutamine amidotransferase [Candidatus Hydrogenedens sp.]|nr:type 1 glutamine amidotransferase [Candidatus Hydrogenedens sp.]